jgi:hypothetical protein
MKILEKRALTKLPTPILKALHKKIIKQFHTSYIYMFKDALPKDSDDAKFCLKLDTYCREMKNILDTRVDAE